MKRTFATLGVAGLALLSVSAPAAHAGADFKICHNGAELMIDIHGSGAVKGHARHADDIIPPNEFLPEGYNWDRQGMADYANSCVPVTLPPVVDPPAVVDPPVVVEQPVVVDPPAEVVTPVVAEVPAALTPAAQAPAPQVAALTAPAANIPAAVSQGTNEGFNAQTAVGGADDSSTRLAGLGVLLGAGAVVALRRKSRTESPTAG